MAKKVLILGDSGTGKTHSMNNLDPKSTFIICPDEKELPFKGWRKNYKTSFTDNNKLDLQNTNFYQTTDPNLVKILLKKISDDMPHIKVIMIDTITMLMTAEYMGRIKEKGFEKFTDLALDTYNILKMLKELREDLTVIVTAHIEDNYDSDGVLKTSFKVIGGKLVGQGIKVEGMFTTVLYTDVTVTNNKREYTFMTQSNGKNTCKSPAGMFDDIKIPNDLSYVIKCIEEFENGDE